MTKDEVKQLDRELHRLAKELGLRDWKITISDEPAVEDAWADTSVVEGQREAVIAFAPDFFTQSAADQQMVLVHELLHCHLGMIAQVVRVSGLEAYVGQPALQLLVNEVNLAIEFAVDAMAKEFARILP